jgi:hypothetical protein
MNDALMRAGALLTVVGGTLAVHDSLVATLREPMVSIASGFLMLGGAAIFALAWVRDERAMGSGADGNA